MNDVAPEILAVIDDLQLRYINALDSQDMNTWLHTFSDDESASYICNTAESAEAGHQIALILDDNRLRLQDRVTFVTRVWAGTYPEYRTRHLVQRTSCQEIQEGLFEVESHVFVSRIPADTGRAELFTTGVYKDRIRVDEQGACFESKHFVMDTSILERYLVFPL
ncbi:MAG: hypothetical protein M0Q54_02655 [Pigmentiphaga sp.]|nr:hypothetical protein [Pigmentiphaga sp.]